jgi:hypothetical protein
MTFESVPIVMILIGVVLLVVGAIILIRQQWIIQWLKGTAGLLLMAGAVYLGVFSISLLGYSPLKEGAPLATVSFRANGTQAFVATVSMPDGSSQNFKLKGELWQIDARIIRWKGLLSMFGFAPGYQLDRIQGRYLALEDERSLERTVYEIQNGQLGFDVWSSANDGWSMLIDAKYGSATYLPMADGATYEVRLESSGLVGRPMNGSALQAITRWE